MNWPSILQTILLGTDRPPLREKAETLPGVPSAAAEKMALEALVRAVLYQKAGFQPSNNPRLADSEPPAPEEPGRPLISATAVRYLTSMLAGTHAEGLSELLGLLETSGKALPAELLPGLLDQCMQHPAIADRLLPLAGERGRWLARQNVRWFPLSVDPATTDWFTGSFEARKQLLEHTRYRNPMLAIAWLEKTWLEEKAEHKVQFLQTLSIRLSDMDLDLLERAFQDKNREVRLAALELLVNLPESSVPASLRIFFSQRLAGAFPPDKREKYLQNTLPDLSEEALKPWFDLLSKSEKTDWRNGLFHLAVRYLPLADLLSMTGKKTVDIVAATDQGNNTGLAEALLQNLVRTNPADWIKAIWQQYSSNFRHALWQKPAMLALLEKNVESLMQHLATKKILLDYDSQFILRALEKHRNPWSKELSDNLLRQYKAAIDGYMPGWHYAATLQTAAWYSNLTDVGATMDISYVAANAYQPKEWSNYLQILRFREKMVREVSEAG